MKTAVKYISDAGLFYVRFKKHFCPKCGNKLTVGYISEIVNSKSPEAKNYDFSNVDTYFVGDVEFRTQCFRCDNCKVHYSFKEMRRIEKKVKKSY